MPPRAFMKTHNVSKMQYYMLILKHNVSKIMYNVSKSMYNVSKMQYYILFLTYYT